MSQLPCLSMKGNKEDYEPLLRALFQSENKILKELDPFISQDQSHELVLSMEVVASLKEKLLIHPVATSQILKQLEASGTGLRSSKTEDKQAKDACKQRIQEDTSPGHDVSQVCKIYLECLDHCLWRLENLEEKLHQEEGEYSALLKRQQKGYFPMSGVKAKQKAIASSEASKFKERIMATSLKKGEMESLFYKILSLSSCLDVASIGKLFPKMIKLCYEKKLLVMNKVYLSLLSSSTESLKAFCEREGEYLLNRFYDKEHDLTHGLMPLTSSKMREIFHVCVRSSKHLMEIFYEHLSVSFSNMKEIESQDFSWLMPLLPLLYMQTVTSSQGVTDYADMTALLKKHTNAIDPLLAEVCSLLQRDMRLVQWCLAHSSRLKTQPLLLLVRDHSPLYVIHKALQLNSLVPSDVLLMLQEHCMARDSSGVLNSFCKNTYIAFCILSQMFEVIEAGMQLDNISTGWQERRRSHSCKLPGSNGTNCFQERQSHSSFYKQNIAEKLKSVQKLLATLQPLVYKLELMEDIYSLLFVRHSDMSDEDHSEASAEEGEIELSFPSLHTDADSLRSLSVSTSLQYPPARDSPDCTSVFAPQNDTEDTTKKKVLDFSEYVVLDENGIERVDFSCKPSYLSSTSANQHVSKSSSLEGRDEEGSASNEQIQWESQQQSSPSCEIVAQRQSSCLSGKSATSSAGELPRTGFLINTLVAWDVMLMLKEALLVYTSECFKQMSGEDTSVRQSIESRVSYLSMCVNEGLWRLQVMVPGTHSFASPDIFDEYLDGTLFSHASQQLVYESPPSSENIKKKLGKDTEPPQIRGSSSEPSSIINFLFAPSSSLITLSLANGNVERIEKIFRAFQFPDTADKREAYLAMRLSQLRPKLSVTHQRSARPRESRVVLDNGSSQNMLQSIGLLAREGTAHVGATNLIHDLVTSLPPPVPKGIPEAAVVNECPVTASFLSPMALVLADLVLTVDVTETTATYILEQIFQKYPVQSSEHKHVEICAGITGYLPLLHQLEATCRAIVSLRESEKEPEGEGPGINAGSNMHKSISVCLAGQAATPFSLLMSSLPLKDVELKAYVHSWSKVLKSISLVQEALLSTTINKEKQPNVKLLLNSQNNQIHLAYKTLIHTLSSEASHLHYKPTRDKSSVKRGAYIRSFYQYLQLMSAMVTQHAEKRFLSKMGSHFSLLAERPVEILGSLIFQECVDPVRLEPIASKMKLSLTSMILQYCCPKFTIPREVFYVTGLPSSAKERTHPLGFLAVRERVIMNSGIITCQDGVYGEVVVQSLLTSLLSSLHEATQSSMVISRTGLRALVLNNTTAPRFLTQVDVQVTLKDTADLSAVDFNKMPPGREAVVFFINLANLMFIHAGLINHILYPSSKLNPQARGVFSNYQLERICAMRRLGYMVGQLGFVSLYDVLYTILQLQNPLSSILVQNDPINRISICESNLICTKLLHKREELYSISELLEPLSSRISFCVTQGTPVSPRVQVLFVDRIEEQLEEAVQEHMRLFFIAQSKRKRKQSVEKQENQNKKVVEKCEVVTSRTVLDYLAGCPTGIVGGMQKLQKSMPLEMAAVIQEFISELSKGKQLEIDVLDREESRGIVLEIFESYEEKYASNVVQDEEKVMPNIRELSGPLWEGSRLPQAVLAYLRRQCPLLSFIVQVFHQTAEHSKKGDGAVTDGNMDYADTWLNILYPPSLGVKPPVEETKKFWPVKNLFSLPRYRALARIYGKNKITSALSSGPDISSIWELADSLLGSCSITRGHKSQLQQHTTVLVEVLLALPPSTKENHPDLTLFLDQLLIFLVQATPSEGDPGPWSYACQIVDGETRYAVVMEAHRTWPAKPAQELLSVVACDPLLPIRFQQLAGIRTSQISLYEKILKLEGLSCTSWQEVEKMSSEEPMRLLQYLVQRKKFSLSVEWAKYHDENAELHRLVDQSYLMEVLDKTTPDFSVASEALESLTHQDLTIIVRELLQKLSNFSTRQFLMEFYLKKHFSECAKSVQTLPGEGGESPVSSEDVVCESDNDGGGGGGGNQLDVCVMLQEVMGLVLIETVAPPVLDRFQLSHLVTSPQLIIEQWLMNIRLEAVDKAVKVLRPFLDMVDTYKITTGKLMDLNSSSSKDTEKVSQDLSWSTFNQLLEIYGAKALDTTGVQLALKPSSIEKASKRFVMPAHPPKMQDWIPDADVRKCPVCQVTLFSMFSRRHHCRRCGRVVCSTCSQHRILVQGYGSLFVRVCLDCYSQTKELNLHNYVQIRPLGDGTFDSVSVSTEDQSPQGGTSLSSDMEGGWYLSKDEQYNDIIRREFCFDYAPSLSLCLAILSHHQDDRKAALCVIKLCHHLFSLITSSLQLMNPTVDHTFVLSMIQTLLASSKVRFGNIGEHQGIGLCEYYTQWVDLLFLMLKSNCGHIIPHEALENMQFIGNLHQRSLQGEKDIGVLMNKRLMQEFLYLRRLRDMLVKKQKWELALDVSTKVGLETNGVWGAWAMASLKAGDFLGARERFSRILERPKNKNRPCKPSLLTEVIKYLESNPFQVNQQVMEQAQRTRSSIMLTDHNKHSSSQALVVLHSLQNLHKIAEGSLTNRDPHQRLSLHNIKKKGSTPKMEPIFQAECKYYLTLYGNHAMTLQYFMRHRQIQECVEFIMHANIDLEIFTENVLVPILRRGQLSQLMESLNACDPHMEKWGKLLLGSCRWLERHGWWNCLLSLQEAMGDRLRASMTLLRMYTDSATSYMTLSSRSEYVNLALTHLQAYLDQQALTTSSPKKKVSILSMSPWQINQNMNMLKLQNDVTKFLATCEAKGGDIPGYVRVLANMQVIKDQSLPILLASDGGRLGVTILLMCLAEVVADGLSLAYRIVEQTQMSVKELLSTCCMVLVKMGHVKQIGRVVAGMKDWEMRPVEVDDALRPSLLTLASTRNAGQLDTLVKLFSNDTARMELFLACGHLRSAYVVAAHVGDRTWVERVKEAALAVRQNHVASMCDKWLSSKDNKKR